MRFSKADLKVGLYALDGGPAILVKAGVPSFVEAGPTIIVEAGLQTGLKIDLRSDS